MPDSTPSDASVDNWSRTPPAANGLYWFHGWSSNSRRSPARTYLVKSHVAGSGRPIYVADGHFMEGGWDGLWLPCAVPAAPKLDRGACVAVRNRFMQVLVSRRLDTVPFFPGMLQLPGGQVEDIEDPEAGALRELMEETGFRPWNGERALHHLVTGPGQKGDRPYSVQVFVCDYEGPDNPSRCVEPEKNGPWEWRGIDELLAGDEPMLPVMREALKLARTNWLPERKAAPSHNDLGPYA